MVLSLTQDSWQQGRVCSFGHDDYKSALYYDFFCPLMVTMLMVDAP